MVLSSIDDILTPEYAWVAEDGEGRKGTFTFDDIVLPASLKDLPTIVESYKTYDDINLVKTGDIGQVTYQLSSFFCCGALLLQKCSIVKLWGKCSRAERPAGCVALTTA